MGSTFEKTITMRIKETQAEYLNRAAQRVGLSRASWMRHLALQEAQRILGEPIPDPDEEDEAVTP